MAFAYAGPIRTCLPPCIHGLCIRGGKCVLMGPAYTWPLHMQGTFELVCLRIYMVFAYAGPIQTRFPLRIHGLCICGAHSNLFPSMYTWPLHTRGTFKLISPHVYMAFAYAGHIQTYFPPRIHGLCISGPYSNSFHPRIHGLCISRAHSNFVSTIV